VGTTPPGQDADGVRRDRGLALRDGRRDVMPQKRITAAELERLLAAATPGPEEVCRCAHRREVHVEDGCAGDCPCGDFALPRIGDVGRHYLRSHPHPEGSAPSGIEEREAELRDALRANARHFVEALRALEATRATKAPVEE
jgi:hypothetical protein